MKDIDIIKNNKLIAFSDFSSDDIRDWVNDIGNPSNEFSLKTIPYHKDWNMLMSVVEKINNRDWVTIYRDECKIHALIVGEFDDIVVVKEGEPTINSVYEAVVKYIKWYNKR